MCFDFSQLSSEASHPQKNWARYDRKCIFVFVYSASYSCPILKKIEFSRQIFEKYSNFMKISHLGAELFHADGQTERQGGKTKLIDGFHNFAKAPKTA
jgi:hypothetical protein